jgi:hypothetical protein
MTAPNDLREAYTGQKRGPQAGFASCLSNSASRCLLTADGDGLGMPEPNTDRAVAGEALEGLPGSKSVARAAEAARNQGDPAGSRRTNYEGQAGRGVQRQEERPEARQGVGFVHSSPQQDASLEAGEGTNRLTKHAQATRCRKNDGSTLANLPASDTPRVSLRSPVREYCTPGSLRGRRATGVPTSTSVSVSVKGLAMAEEAGSGGVPFAQTAANAVAPDPGTGPSTAWWPA